MVIMTRSLRGQLGPTDLHAFLYAYMEQTCLNDVTMNKRMSMYDVAIGIQHGRHSGGTSCRPQHSGHNIQDTAGSPGLLQHLILPHSCIVLNQLLRTARLQSEVYLSQSLG